MKKLLLGMLFLSGGYYVNAQVSYPPYVQKTEPLQRQEFSKIPFADNSLRNNNLNKNKMPGLIPEVFNQPKKFGKNEMPVVGKIPAEKFAFNNGNGFDVYISPLDNMSIIKPDASFVSRLPVAGNNSIVPGDK